MEKITDNLLRGIASAMLIFCAGCSDEKQLFRKLDPSDSGISFANKLNPTDDFNIIDYIYFYNGGGVAIGDINGDNLPDIFFSGNQVENKLYLNKGNLEFEDITSSAGVAGKSSWKTGSLMADVNGDGLLDIYVCAVVGIKHLTGHNELYINNGDNTFSERSDEYGLDFESYSSSAAFLDYDRDGDLDMYLLNHAIHTPEAFGHANLRNVRTYESGGKLLRNDGGKFVDVSENAKIYGGVNGYGLGVAISDFNRDGYPDIYVGNDFHEDDYYYINNRDGTFSEKGRESLTSTSKFSMGIDVADINHDSHPDIITLDMLPENEEVLKRSVDDENISIQRLRTGKYGYRYQFPRNTLQVNLGNGKFAETALMSNVAATDWSWSALFADFDHDGNQDLFISNGIPRRPNDLDYIKYVSSEQVVNTIGKTKLVDEKALALMPSGAVRNYVFKGSGSYQFEDKSGEWLPNENDCSTASAYGDLDGDGDLDLVVNNVDASAGIYVNETNGSSSYLTIKLSYQAPNHFGIGSTVHAYHAGILQSKELYTVRGFQASSQPIIHFGFGDAKVVDSLRVIWPDGTSQLMRNIETNKSIVISPADKRDTGRMLSPAHVKPIFEPVPQSWLGLDFLHQEDNYTDFDRLKLLPYQQSDRGPATAVGDLNNDGLDDVYFGGSKRVGGKVFLQSQKGFIPLESSLINADSVREITEAVIADLNSDGREDLLLGSGGADFYGRARQLTDVLYFSDGRDFSEVELPDYYENASCIKQFDFDNDGDIDLFIGNESVSNDFGKMPRSCLLVNNKGKLAPAQQRVFDNLGMVTDAVWDDYDKDGQVDLIVVGEWMEPTFLRNDKGTFHKEELLTRKLGGLWQSITPIDIDGDGDRDYVVGNWGLNSRYVASEKFPLKMYYNDFDKNGSSETVLAIAKDGAYYPLDGFDLLASQLPFLKKRYTSYREFAGKTVSEIFPDELKESKVYEVRELATGYLVNNENKFEFVRLPLSLQVSPVMALLSYDFDFDGKTEVLAAGNYFGVQPFHGRFASFPGAIIRQNAEILPGHLIGLDLCNKSVRQLNVLEFQKNKYLIVTHNNDSAQVYKLAGGR